MGMGGFRTSPAPGEPGWPGPNRMVLRSWPASCRCENCGGQNAQLAAQCQWCRAPLSVTARVDDTASPSGPPQAHGKAPIKVFQG